jgi:hypothetical protein
MALTPSITISSVAPITDGSVTNILDETVYGDPEAERNTLAVYLLAHKVTETGTDTAPTLEETEVTVQTYDPLTATDWVVENGVDGYYKYIQLIIPVYDSDDTYEQYDLVYYDGAIYQNTEATPLQGVDPTENVAWVVYTAEEIYALMDTAAEPQNLVISILGFVLTYASQQCLGILAPKHARVNCCGCAGDIALKEKFDELWLLVFNANIASTRLRFIEGERFMRSADLYCEC